VLSPDIGREAVASRNGRSLGSFSRSAQGEYLDSLLECPCCGTIRLNTPADARPSTSITCAECGKYLGTWDELQADFERQGGGNGVFRLDKGRIKRLL
jgi:hypothetical protein